MIDALTHCSKHTGRRREIHVRDPHRNHVGLAGVAPFQAVRSPPVNRMVKIEFHLLRRAVNAAPLPYGYFSQCMLELVLGLTQYEGYLLWFTDASKMRC